MLMCSRQTASAAYGLPSIPVIADRSLTPVLTRKSRLGTPGIRLEPHSQARRDRSSVEPLINRSDRDRDRSSLRSWNYGRIKQRLALTGDGRQDLDRGRLPRRLAYRRGVTGRKRFFLSRRHPSCAENLRGPRTGETQHQLLA
jgi:hypothetical protein